MPLAALTHSFSLARDANFDWFNAKLEKQNIVLIGVREVDPLEQISLSASGIKVFTGLEVHRKGMDKVMHEALDLLLSGGERPLHLSFDIDALDGAIVPGTGTPSPGGLSLMEGELLCKILRHTNLLVGMDLVEVNPLLEKQLPWEIQIQERTLTCARALILAALGKAKADDE